MRSVQDYRVTTHKTAIFTFTAENIAAMYLYLRTEAHKTSCPVGTGVFCLRGKQLARDFSQSDNR
jgi:hypothetical protein